MVKLTKLAVLLVVALAPALLWADSTDDMNGSVEEQWRFSFDDQANPAAPDVDGSGNGATAIIVVGHSGIGWLDSHPAYGEGWQGFWFLGSEGTATVQIAGPPQLMASQEVTVRVVYFKDIPFFLPPTVTVTDAELVADPTVEEIEKGPTSGAWLRAQSTWSVGSPGPQTVVVTSATGWGSVVDEVTVESMSHPLPGDATGDCRVDILDMLFVRCHLNDDPGVGDNWKADMNDDGRIDILDMMFVRGRLSTSCDE